MSETTDILEYQNYELKVPCLPLSVILLSFLISHSLNTKGHAGSEKAYSNFIQKILLSKCTNLDTNFLYRLHNMSIKTAIFT